MSTEPKVIVLNTTQTKISEQNRTTDGIAALIASLSDFEGTPEPKQEPYRKSSENLASKQGETNGMDSFQKMKRPIPQQKKDEDEEEEYKAEEEEVIDESEEEEEYTENSRKRKKKGRQSDSNEERERDLMDADLQDDLGSQDESNGYEGTGEPYEKRLIEGKFVSLGNKKLKPQKKKPKPRKAPNERMSFQEAAVQILSEQKAKGVFALTTRRIWELIQEAELVDTKCKTPVSSLSSRITEDVRTKGNKSVFVRVGEGLYTLRKGMKKVELEKYMNSQLPNLDGRRNEDEDMEEEEEEEPEDSEEQDENDDEEAPRKKGIQREWIGLPLKRSPEGNLYYGQVKVGKYRFRVGDFAYFSSNRVDERAVIGQILKMWQSNSKAKELKASVGGVGEQMLFKCKMFLYPEDTNVPMGGIRKKMGHHKHELFLSESIDFHNVNNIISPVDVVSLQEYTRRVDSNSANRKDRDLYFCRYAFQENTKKFIPLRTLEGGNLDLYTEEKEQPTNWPSAILYTEELICREVPSEVRDYAGSLCRSDLLNINVELIAPTTEASAESGNTNANRERHGLYAKNTLAEGTMIGEYTGFLTVVPKSDHKRTAANPGKTKYRNTIYDDPAVMITIDSTHAGNELRFIADSKTVNKAPNVQFVPIQLRNHKWHIFVFTKTTIKAGEELVLDYPSGPIHTISMRPKTPVESDSPYANGQKIEINLQSRNVPSPVNLPSPQSSPSSVSSGSNEQVQAQPQPDVNNKEEIPPTGQLN